MRHTQRREPLRPSKTWGSHVVTLQRNLLFGYCFRRAPLAETTRNKHRPFHVYPMLTVGFFAQRLEAMGARELRLD
jgi:hypothetical protein